MTEISTLLARAATVGGVIALSAAAAYAQTETGIDTAAPAAAATEAAAEAAAEGAGAGAADTAFIFNTLLFLMSGFLVMFMAAGFAMLEAGLVRSKNASMQCLKNIAIYSTASLMFWLIGYNLMYEGVDGGYFGTFSWKVIPDPAEDTGDYAAASDFFFQLVFCATTASIVSGTVAERVRLWPFMIFTAILTGILYPITGSWEWGTGWLDQMGFADFAGSTLVHSVGGWAALAGAIVIGARTGRFGPRGEAHAMPGSSMPLATLGVFILWLGWFGFNGGSQLALGTLEDASSVARIFVNTNTAAAAGVIAAMILTQVLYKKVDITIALNGAIAGLVSITAEPLTPTLLSAAIIGGIGGVIVVVAVPLLDRMRIDDVVGAIPAHLIAGIWGTMAVPITNGDASFGVQLVGVVSIGAFIFIVSMVIWMILKMIGARASLEEESMGLDQAEIGVVAYPEFHVSGQRV